MRIYKRYAGTDFEMSDFVCEVYGELIKRLNLPTALVIGKSGTEFEKGFITVTDCAEKYDAVIVRNLDNNMLARLALGLAADDGEKAILKSLCGGNVYIMRNGMECFKNKNILPKRLYRLYCGYADTLIGWGAKIIGFGKVITEKAAAEFFESGGRIIYAEKDSIITPLAADFITKYDMVLERR